MTLLPNDSCLQAVLPALSASKDSTTPDVTNANLTILVQLQKELEVLEDPGSHPAIQALGHVFCLKEPARSFSYGMAVWRLFLFAAAFVVSVLLVTVLLEPPGGLLPS